MNTNYPLTICHYPHWAKEYLEQAISGKTKFSFKSSAFNNYAYQLVDLAPPTILTECLTLLEIHNIATKFHNLQRYVVMNSQTNDKAIFQVVLKQTYEKFPNTRFVKKLHVRPGSCIMYDWSEHIPKKIAAQMEQLVVWHFPRIDENSEIITAFRNNLYSVKLNIEEGKYEISIRNLIHFIAALNSPKL
jgi:aromatic ring-opening dioxygenase LigB subunit